MKPAVPAALRWPAGFGWPGTIAVLALLASVPPALLAPRWQAEAAAARRIAAARAALPASSATRASYAPPPPAPVPPAAQLPGDAETPARVGRMLQVAQRHRVKVERTTQRLDGALVAPRVQLGFSAQGSYADLRAFVAAALQADAALSLDRLQLRRTTPEVDMVDADLQWSLWQAPRGGALP